jgi:hypothetical protein
VTSALAEQLALAQVPAGPVRMLGVHDLTENPVVQIQSLAVRDAEARVHQAVILDLDHITRGEWRADGILGMDFLRQFDLRLDFGGQSVVFVPSGVVAELRLRSPGPGRDRLRLYGPSRDGGSGDGR